MDNQTQSPGQPLLVQVEIPAVELSNVLALQLDQPDIDLVGEVEELQELAGVIVDLQEDARPEHVLGEIEAVVVSMIEVAHRPSAACAK